MSKRSSKKILVIAHARWGKDTFCEMLQQRGLLFHSASQICVDEIIWPKMKFRYKNKQECYEDRVNHRSEWFDLISEFNTPDKSRLAKLVLKKSDIYCGIRSREEFEAAKHLFDEIVWVEAGFRLPEEPETSMQLNKSDATVIVNNNSTLDVLETSCDWFMENIYYGKK